MRERYRRSRGNLIRLLPVLAALRVFINSTEADPSARVARAPKLIVDVRRGRIVAPTTLDTLLTGTPRWAKPIAAAALKRHLRG